MPRTKFSEGERVLCFHGPLIYEAKCLKVSLNKDKMTPKYFIHYAGWNKNWDEWVPETRILKYNDANLSKQEEVKLAHNDQQKLLKKSRKSKTHLSNLSDSSSESGSSSGRKESKGVTSAVATETLATSTTTSTISTRLKRESISRTSTPNSEIINDGERTNNSSNVMTPGTKSIENGNGPSKRKRTKVSASTSIEVTAIVNEVVAEETEGQSEQLTGTATATKTPTTPPVMTQEEDENDSQIVPKESFLKQLEINFAIPKELNVILVDDWNFVLRERKLLTIPAKVNVVTVLKNFVEWQKERTATSVATTSTSGSSPEEQNLCIGAVEEFVEGIKDYFNVMLGSQLLYRFERIQFAEILEKYPGKKMMEIYGSFHLLRMFVRLGATISHSLMDEKCIQLLQFHVKQLLTYLSKNNVFDFSEYYPASPEYIRKTL